MVIRRVIMISKMDEQRIDEKEYKYDKEGDDYKEDVG